MSNNSPKLLGHPRLKPGESLNSFLARLSKLNFYDSPSTLADLVFSSQDSPVEDSLRCPRQVTTFERLTELTGIDCLTLYSATAHQFAPSLVLPGDEIELLYLPGSQGVPLLSKGMLKKQLRPELTSQFCPTCLKHMPYHHLAWLHIATSVCLEHGNLLVNSCYSCNKSIDVCGIVGAHCRTCGFDLRKIPAIQVSDDFGFVAQCFIQAWLLNKTPAEASRLPPEPPRVLLRVLEGMHYFVQSLISAGNPDVHTIDGRDVNFAAPYKFSASVLDPYQSYCIYTTAFKGLMDWPAGFQHFLDAQCATLDSQSRSGRVTADFGRLYTLWLRENWQDMAFDFVQKAFDDYIVERYNLSRSILHSNRFRRTVMGRIAHVSTSYASKHLGVAPSIVQRLVDSGQLDPKYTPNNKGPVFVKQADLLELRDSWYFLLSLKEVAKLIGVSERIVLDMVKSNSISAEQTTTEGWGSWKFSKSEALEFIKKVRDRTEMCSPRFTHVNLLGASRILRSIGLNACSIIAHVIEGKLRAYHEPGKSFACRNLYFDPRDLQAHIETIKLENNWVSHAQATKLLRVSDMTLAKWVESGLIMPVAVYAVAQYFERGEIEKFLSDYATSEEAAELLDIGEFTVRRLTRQGHLEAVSGPAIDGCRAYRFKKEYLVRWAHERLSFSQALQVLGVSSSMLQQWVETGKITPLDDMGAKQKWFSKSSILELRGEVETKPGFHYGRTDLRFTPGTIAYSQDIRLRVLQAADQGIRRAEIAKTFQISRATIARYLKQRRETGHVLPKANAHAKIGEALQDELRKQLETHPEATLKTLCCLWKAEHGMPMKTTTMSRAVHALGWKRKKNRWWPPKLSHPWGLM